MDGNHLIVRALIPSLLFLFKFKTKSQKNKVTPPPPPKILHWLFEVLLQKIQLTLSLPPSCLPTRSSAQTENRRTRGFLRQTQRWSSPTRIDCFWRTSPTQSLDTAWSRPRDCRWWSVRRWRVRLAARGDLDSRSRSALLPTAPHRRSVGCLWFCAAECPLPLAVDKLVDWHQQSLRYKDVPLEDGDLTPGMQSFECRRRRGTQLCQCWHIPQVSPTEQRPVKKRKKNVSCDGYSNHSTNSSFMLNIFQNYFTRAKRWVQLITYKTCF